MEHLLSTLAVGSVERTAHWTGTSAGLGHLINDVLPEDRFEAQPCRSADGNLVLVTDAILENRPELAAALGWRHEDTATLPDSAFVLAAYEKWGEACPARLDGRWAFVVWHVRERRLFGAVDHFAFRPLYYHRRESSFGFASTLRGVLAMPDVSRAIHDGVLADFLIGGSRHPGQSLYRDIAVIPAAHCFRVEAGRFEIRRYWQAHAGPELRLRTDADYVAAFQHEFEQTIAAHLRVSGNVGIMVSGGLDSASVTAVAGRLLAERGQRLQAIHRLSPVFDPRRAHLRETDESPYVRQMQAHSPHIDFHFLPRGDPANRRISLSNWDQSLDEECVPLRGFAFEQIEPNDSGLGDLGLGRMLFGGGGNYVVSLECYPSPYFVQLATRLRWVRLAQELSGHGAFYGRSVRHLVRTRILAPVFAPSPSDEGKPGVLEFLQPDFVARANLTERAKWSRTSRWHPMNFDVRRQTEWVMNNLFQQNVPAASSVLSSGHQIDGVSPLMSRRLNEFCLSMPIDQQFRAGKDRLLLRRAMQGTLPDEVIWRRTRGFPTPAVWGAARALVAELPAALDQIERSPLACSYVNVAELRRRFTADGEGELLRLGAPSLRKLFNVAWFLRWLEHKGPASISDISTKAG